ncbi:MAG TPA: carbohydrate-binding domain-containing protein [Clostridiales bacterium]|nr:carbohydrate-binding domain-containing protein [Clostridiales bacterium]
MNIHRKYVLSLLTFVLAICLVFSGCSGNKTNTSSDGTSSRYIIDHETGQVIDTETGEVVSNAIIDSSTGNIIDASTGEVIYTPGQESKPSIESKAVSDIVVEYDSSDEAASWDTAEQNHITLNGGSIEFSGEGASVAGNIVTITKTGTYLVSGKLNDGQIVVDTAESDNVQLVLNNADISCSFSAPINIKNASKTVIVLANGSNNKVTDGNSYNFDPAGVPNAAIFSKSNLTINGSGKLLVNANYRNGIESRDELKITGGNITVNSANHGLRGKDCVAIKNADVTINSKGDGIQSDNEKSSEKGYVVIEGNNIRITSAEDGIQAQTSLAIKGGNLTIVSGGGSSASPSDISTKGIKAEVDIIIENATINVDSSDDAIHCNSTLSINSGNLQLATADDAIHSNVSIDINGGNINITKSHEGLEGAVITINGGNIRIQSENDGINVSGQNLNGNVKNRTLIINDGYLYINAGDDGIDSNGTINIAGGTVIVNSYGTESEAIDYSEGLKITGGFVVAAGYDTKSHKVETGSDQYSIRIKLPKLMTAGTVVHIESTNKEEIVTFVPANNFKSFFISSPKLKKGVTYSIYLDGKVSGNSQDGLYSGGYSGGTKYTQITIE